MAVTLTLAPFVAALLPRTLVRKTVRRGTPRAHTRELTRAALRCAAVAGLAASAELRGRGGV